MKKSKQLIFSLVWMFLSIGIGVGYAGDVTIQVCKSDGITPIENIDIQYKEGYWKAFGTTNASGIATKTIDDGTYEFKAIYDGTTAVQNLTVSGTTTGNFYTTGVVVTVYKHNGTDGLNDVDIQYKAGYWREFGTTHSGPGYDGKKGRQLFPNTLDFKAIFLGSNAIQEVDLAGDGATPGIIQDITFYTSAVVVRVKKHNLDPLDDVEIFYKSGYWHSMGLTHDGGLNGQQLFPNPDPLPFKASFLGTQAIQDVTVLGDGTTSGNLQYVDFYTSAMVVEVKGCDPSVSPVEGANTYYNAGYWRSVGMGVANSNGRSGMNRFPGTYQFKVTYGGTQHVDTYTIPGDGTTSGQEGYLEVNPTLVTIDLEGTKQYKAGYWRSFTGPIYMFPGTYQFKFNGTPETLTIEGCTFLYPEQLNNPPVAICQDITVDAETDCSAVVTPEQVDNGSYDPDGDEITFDLVPSGPFSLGSTTVTLMVEDESGEQDVCTATITVEDNINPTLQVESDPFVLWPPNHKYKAFDVSDFVVSVGDNCTPLSSDDVYITHVTSDEPEDAQGGGDGNTTEDIVIDTDCKTMEVRKERQGGGNGRVYTVYFEVEDGNGQSANASCEIHVPHNPGASVIDDGMAYEEWSECSGLKYSIFDKDQPAVQLTCFPNPFTGSITIEYILSESGPVKIFVYDIMGKKVAELLDKNHHLSGVFNVSWNGKTPRGYQAPQGTYFIRIVQQSNSVVKPVIKR